MTEPRVGPMALPEPFDINTLPMAQNLIMETLVARYRLGHPAWTFVVRPGLKRALQELELRGLLWFKGGTIQRTFLVGLTQEGRRAGLWEDYEYPLPQPVLSAYSVRLLEVIHHRHGRHAYVGFDVAVRLFHAVLKERHEQEKRHEGDWREQGIVDHLASLPDQR